MVTHCLKIKSEHYINVINGTKTAETKKPKIIEKNVSVLNVFMTYQNVPCAGIALVTDDDQTIIITPCLELLLQIRDGINNAINVLDPDYLKKEINKIKA